MNRNSRILLGVTLLFVVLSVAATFYKTVILQDFDVTGVHIEFPTKNTSYVWFIYNNEEYELELETSNYEEILTEVAQEIDIPETSLDVDFIKYIQSAYLEAKTTTTENAEDENTTGDFKSAEPAEEEQKETAGDVTNTHEDFLNTEPAKTVIELEI
jgi:hypothetical protein